MISRITNYTVSINTTIQIFIKIVLTITLMFEFHISLDNLSSVTTDWLNVIISVTTLGLAVYALNSWKQQKVYDIDTKALSIIGKLQLAFVHTLDVSTDINSLSKEQEIDYKQALEVDQTNGWWAAALFTYQNRITQFKEINIEISEIAVQVMRHSKDKNLIALFKFYYLTQLNVSTSIVSYYIDSARRHLSEIGELGDIAYSLSDDEYDRLHHLILEDFKPIRDEFFNLCASVNSTFLNRIVK